MTIKLRLDIPIILPGVSDAADACVARLISELKGHEGISDAHVTGPQPDGSAQLCVHYDTERLPLARIRELVESAGARITQRFGHVLLQVDGNLHERRARTAAARLRTLPGVLEAGASATGLVRVEFDRERTTEQAIRDVLSELGLITIGDLSASRPPIKTASRADKHGAPGHTHTHKEGTEHSHGGVFGSNAELVFSILCGGLLGIGYAAEKLSVAAPDWLPITLYVAAYFFGGFYTVREAFENLRLRKFEIDTLMLVAAAGAAALGAWAEGALLLFLFSLGHALEHFAMGRAKQAIEALAELAPRTATVRRDGETREVPVEALVVGDIVVVRPNERLPGDGFLVKGESSINQAPVTGESIPVDKRPVDDPASARAKPNSVDSASRVFAGTINGAGAIELEVTRLATDTALAKIVQMVNEAETQKSPTQRFTEKFERIFVPAVLALAVLLLFAWVVVDEPFSASFYRAMAVLVAASPCALAIATPSAVLSAVARAARGGVLIKGGAPLENLGLLAPIEF